MHTLQKNLKWIDKNGKGVFWSFVCVLLFMATCYVYLINMAAQNGVGWSKAEQSIAMLGAEVSELESSYLSLKQSVTLSLAYAKGFEDVKAVRFIGAEKVGSAARVSSF